MNIIEDDELVKYMNNLPSYLEKTEKIFNVGVLDWSRLQKWQNDNKQFTIKANQPWHTPHQRIRRPTLGSHLIKDKRDMELEIRKGVKSSVNSSILTSIAAKVRSFSPARRSANHTQPNQTTVSVTNPDSCKSHSTWFRINQTMTMKATKTIKAQMRIVVKNAVPVFIFGKPEILAATVKNRCYTFFAVHEMKKTGFVPRVVAEMEALMRREFVLSALDKDELAAIVVRGDSPVTITSVLPAGIHGVPADGKPSPLLHRWKSGGNCDCGGWDLGCKLKVLSGKLHLSGGSTPISLFFQDEAPSSRPVFSITLAKGGVYAVEFTSSLSFLQAFAICVAIMDSTKLSTLANMAVNGETLDNFPANFVSYPPVSPVGRA